MNVFNGSEVMMSNGHEAIPRVSKARVVGALVATTAMVIAVIGGAVIGGAVTGVGIAAAAAATPAAATPSTWAQTDGNGAAARSNLDETVLSTSSVLHLTHRRAFTLPVPPDNPCPYGRVDNVASSGTVDYLEGNGYLRAYTAATGHQQWSVKPDSGFDTFWNSIAVAHGLVILGGSECVSQSDPGGTLVAYNQSTGHKVWTQYPDTELSRMVVSGSYVVETGSSAGSGEVTSVRTVATGALVWQTTGNDCGLYDGNPTVVVVAQQVVTHHCDDDTGAISLVANSLTTGAQTWTRAVDWPILRADSGASGARHLFTKNDSGSVIDLDPATGATQYYLSGASTVLAVDATRIYAKCGSGSVCAFTLSTGAALWSTPDSSALAAEANGVLYLQNGRMLDAATGAALARLYSTGNASVLVVAGGRVGTVTSARTFDLYGPTGS